MNAERILQYIYDYTSGYPFLVSKICQLLDTSKEIKNKIKNKMIRDNRGRGKSYKGEELYGGCELKEGVDS